MSRNSISAVKLSVPQAPPPVPLVEMTSIVSLLDLRLSNSTMFCFILLNQKYLAAGYDYSNKMSDAVARNVRGNGEEFRVVADDPSTDTISLISSCPFHMVFFWRVISPREVCNFCAWCVW
jgi:hypothetical protein